jgi:dephospho-CoA kinase
LPILDADIYAREAVATGSEILDKIVNQYGNTILLADGSLDRPQLAEIIFTEPEQKQYLENLIHPYVRRKLQEDNSKISSGVRFLVVPLLFEAKMSDLVDEIWLVYCQSEKQIKRLQSRNQLSRQQAQQRIDAQWTLDAKKDLAHVLIENTKDLNYLYRQIDNLISEYL